MPNIYRRLFKALVQSKEVWKPIKGYEGHYEVSWWGRVKSLARSFVRERNGSVVSLRERILRQVPKGPSGYPSVTLSLNGQIKSFFTYDLVLTHFIGPRVKGMECRHFPDRDINNSRANNLRWGTKQQNINDKRIHGTINKVGIHIGMNNHAAKLTDETIPVIRRWSENGIGDIEIARMVEEKWNIQVCPVVIYAVRKRKSWKHIK